MDKIFNSISLIIGIIGGIVIKFLGGWDLLLQALLVVVILDYVTGIIKAIKNKNLSSHIGFIGILKKFMVFIVVAMAVVIQNIVGQSIPLREMVLMFYITNECLSLLENGAEFIPLPPKLKDILIQIRDKEITKNENSTN